MKKFILITILCIINILVTSANYTKRFEGGAIFKTKYFAKLQTDTCVISGLNFKILDYISNRSFEAVIKDNCLQITGGSYRIVHYVFSSNNDDQMPSLRIFDQRIDYRIEDILKYSKPGQKYTFEDIILSDRSGKKLRNEVKPIMIERVE